MAYIHHDVQRLGTFEASHSIASRIVRANPADLRHATTPEITGAANVVPATARLTPVDETTDVLQIGGEVE